MPWYSSGMRHLLVIPIVGLTLAGCGDKDDTSSDDAAATRDDTQVETDADADSDADTDTDADADADSDADTDADADTDPGDPIEIGGNWTDDFGALHVIDDAKWTMDFDGEPYGYTIASYDNSQRVAIAENDPDNGEGAFSRFDWYEDQGVFSFCQQVDFADAAAAEAASRPDVAVNCPYYGATLMPQ